MCHGPEDRTNVRFIRTPWIAGKVYSGFRAAKEEMRKLLQTESANDETAVNNTLFLFRAATFQRGPCRTLQYMDRNNWAFRAGLDEVVLTPFGAGMMDLSGLTPYMKADGAPQIASLETTVLNRLIRVSQADKLDFLSSLARACAGTDKKDLEQFLDTKFDQVAQNDYPEGKGEQTFALLQDEVYEKIEAAFIDQPQPPWFKNPLSEIDYKFIYDTVIDKMYHGR
eukprot:TRINITY_DN5951_c0_g2_i1.p1 TRINITY_DN5951_c0_g2~~TRINITY_DN5951_c0_g2_i1.p1  ORF type:complete len:225 (-),score=41.40 TRINITY_DN5951_c0_g2_i1:153-827(-)